MILKSITATVTQVYPFGLCTAAHTRLDLLTLTRPLLSHSVEPEITLRKVREPLHLVDKSFLSLLILLTSCHQVSLEHSYDCA